MKITHDCCICERHRPHRVVLNDDGTVETPDHPEALGQGKRMAAFARMGRPLDIEGCSTVVALAHAADMLCNFKTASDAPAPWRVALGAYGSNRVVTAALAAASARQQVANERLAGRLLVELAKCSWFTGQRLTLASGLTADVVQKWGIVTHQPGSGCRSRTAGSTSRRTGR